MQVSQRYDVATFRVCRRPYGAQGRLRIVSLDQWDGPLSTNEVWIGPDISPVVGLSWGDVKAHYRPDGYGSN